jgi:hypothetical protein
MIHAKVAYQSVISLGAYCQCAYQIRRYTGCNSASYFDWLGTPYSGLIHELTHEFKTSFRLLSLRRTNGNRHVIDKVTGIIYAHTFSRDPHTATIRSLTILREFRKQREKREYLTTKWALRIRREDILFVRHGHLTTLEAYELYGLLRSHAGRNRIGLACLVPDNSDLNVRHEHIYVRSGFPIPAGAHDWRGDDLNWDAFFNEFIPHLESTERTDTRTSPSDGPTVPCTEYSKTKQ